LDATEQTGISDNLLLIFSPERHLLNSYRRAIDPPTRVTSAGKRCEYIRVRSTATSLPPTFPPEATRIGLSQRHSPHPDLLIFINASILICD
jgi:hypothetical protein